VKFQSKFVLFEEVNSLEVDVGLAYLGLRLVDVIKALDETESN
jgi:hypothetical protein